MSKNKNKPSKDHPDKLPDLYSKDIQAMIRPRPYDSAFRTIKETCSHLIWKKEEKGIGLFRHMKNVFYWSRQQW